MKYTFKPSQKYEQDISIRSVDDEILENKNYWLNSFSESAWEDFISSGGNVTGFREKRWDTVKKIKYGDYFLCYLSDISGFISILKVVSKPYFDKDTQISRIDLLPARISVDVLFKLKPESAVSILDLKEELSIFKELKNLKSWSMLIKSPPKLLRKEDGALIARSIIQKR